MGKRNPDRVPLAVRYRQGRTVADMLSNRWEVISVCEQCQLQMIVRLDWIARLAGPRVSLWNRRQRCRRLLCSGFVFFTAKAPGMNQFERLVIDMRERDG